MLVLIAVLPDGTETPVIVVALMSYPAGMLANLFPAILPVRVEGSPELTLYPLLTVAFGFVQWFIVVPWLFGKVLTSHRNVQETRAGVAGQRVSRIVLVLGTWLIAEALAIVLSISLNGASDRVVRHVNGVVFHLWLAVPGAVAAAIAALVIARLFHARDFQFWIVALAALFLCASVLNAATLFLGVERPCDRLGPIVEAVIPALVCVPVGRYAFRRLSPKQLV